MRDRAIYLALRRSLDAAFRGQAFEGPEAVGTWGVDFVTALREGYPKYRFLINGLWVIACEILYEFACSRDSDDLTEEILLNPEAFLRTVILVARQRGLLSSGTSALPQDLQ